MLARGWPRDCLEGSRETALKPLICSPSRPGLAGACSLGSCREAAAPCCWSTTPNICTVVQVSQLRACPAVPACDCVAGREGVGMLVTRLQTAAHACPPSSAGRLGSVSATFPAHTQHAGQVSGASRVASTAGSASHARAHGSSAAHQPWHALALTEHSAAGLGCEPCVSQQ